MDVSEVLARFWGIFYIVLPAVFLVKGKAFFEEMSRLLKNTGFSFTMGLLAFLTGAAAVSVHNVWAADWRVFVTLVGWLALLKGVFKLFFPRADRMVFLLFRDEELSLRMLLGVMMVFGVWLSWMGWLH